MESTPQKLGLILKYFDDFTPHQIKQFEALEELYKEWNAKINVISRKDIDSIYLHHVLHSLSIAAIADFQPGTEVIDIGCGGGFPGVPLAIFFPEVKFHLVDSIAKKLKVVEAVAEGAGIKNITTQHTRAEDIKNRKFDFAVSRAVAPLKELWQWAGPLLKKGHKQEMANGLICLKGGDLAQEIFESGLRPKMMPVDKIFPESYFDEKYILHVTK
ncbi:MAG: 16S rRNA (guanine(527)-N(7))-methyltransferase RsmG [Sediminibacterium sp.]|jgi:16S rRNA (guanine527-N7)-methyltransferase|uniref:16S rRNA (guanine(527)-N(7))-methyltransferase RsmG n=1 Tax=unclassified Sediminibacterium TaxID=2635961 RepID=UPI0025CE80AE|nr:MULTISPECIES: 16S rRNA (guanine(527)-N(7))-methyltransferase RsmG [unclassified Sediminibacterium]MDZ4072356.1 16S rRNA (guanine(527)-N(7))-methyltransferase RsmG [Sediminibacterium sp.]